MKAAVVLQMGQGYKITYEDGREDIIPEPLLETAEKRNNAALIELNYKVRAYFQEE
jgi:hypothetical protein